MFVWLEFRVVEVVFFWFTTTHYVRLAKRFSRAEENMADVCVLLLVQCPSPLSLAGVPKSPTLWIQNRQKPNPPCSAPFAPFVTATRLSN